MIRILCVIALLAVAGARHDKDSWKYSIKRFIDTLNPDISISIRKTAPARPSYDSTPAPSSTTAYPKHGCVSTSTADYQPTSSTAAACEPTKSTVESTTRQYPGKHVRSISGIKGIPGVNFPVYTNIPSTSYSCSDKEYIPGFYADIETGCQVFHVCWPHRRESFLCPVGTTFNQALLACDYWYSSNCSLAPIYYNANVQSVKMSAKKDINSMVQILLGAKQLEAEKSSGSTTHSSLTTEAVFSFVSQFLPVKAKVTVYPATADSQSKIVATASVGKVQHRDVKYGKQTLKSEIKIPPTSTAAAASQSQYSTQSPETSTKNYTKFGQAIQLLMKEVFGPSDMHRDVHRGKQTAAGLESQYSTQSPKTSTNSPEKVGQAVKMLINKILGVSDKPHSATTAPGGPESQYSTQSTVTSTEKISEVKQALKLLLDELIAATYNPKGVHHGKQSIKTSEKPHSAFEAVAGSESQYSTKSPEAAKRYAELEQAIKLILNELLDTLPNKTADAPKSFDVHKPMTSVHKHLPKNPDLNPKFVVKPIAIPTIVQSPAKPTPKDVRFQYSKERPATIIFRRAVKGKIPRQPRLSVSPMTKTALARNYLRLLKMRS